MKHHNAVLACIVFVAGCAVNGPSERPLENAVSINTSTATKSDVYRLLGAPYSQIVSTDGKDVWAYTYVSQTASPAPGDLKRFTTLMLLEKKRTYAEMRRLMIAFLGDRVSGCAFSSTSMWSVADGFPLAATDVIPWKQGACLPS